MRDGEEEDETVENVTNFEGLKAAIESEEVETINIMNDIEVTEKLQILSEKNINGNEYKLTFKNDSKEWQGNYVLQFYKTTGSVKDLTITGGDAAILVNGSTVTLEGTVDVSGNEFGGIEVTQGKGVTINPKLTVNATLTFTDENLPAIWIDGKTTNDGWVVGSGFELMQTTATNQVWFKVTE